MLTIKKILKKIEKKSKLTSKLMSKNNCRYWEGKKLSKEHRKNISLGGIGKHNHSIETRMKLSNATTLSNNIKSMSLN